MTYTLNLTDAAETYADDMRRSGLEDYQATPELAHDLIPWLYERVETLRELLDAVWDKLDDDVEIHCAIADTQEYVSALLDAERGETDEQNADVSSVRK